MVDTVFVVADWIDHNASDQSRKLEGRISDTYRKVTIDPWYLGAPPERQSHRLYVGATPEQPYGAMFSFFPCLPFADAGKGFARPEIRIPGFITDPLNQGKKVALNLSVARLTELWQDVARQVEEQGLLLGVQAELPEQR